MNPMNITLSSIEYECRGYADARKRLADEVTELNEAIENLKRTRIKRIKSLVNSAAEKHAGLKATIEAAPQLFEKPRTVVFYGVKVGLQKGKGGLAIADEAFTLRKINDVLEHPEAYIRVKETPNKEALAGCTAQELKRLGIEIIDAGDEVVIKPTDSAVDKIVNALLKDATEETEAA